MEVSEILNYAERLVMDLKREREANKDLRVQIGYLKEQVLSLSRPGRMLRERKKGNVQRERERERE